MNERYFSFRIGRDIFYFEVNGEGAQIKSRELYDLNLKTTNLEEITDKKTIEEIFNNKDKD